MRVVMNLKKKYDYKLLKEDAVSLVNKVSEVPAITGK
jgi:hypothetical protein